ncbi:MAG: diadenylate cyclase CdaA [Hespellia sp.]|nr:diadenylate cyclase CdaA [Hespellia sp.]
MSQRITQFFDANVKGVYFPNIRIVDIVEIIIVAFVVYEIMVWIKNTKAWMLLKGMVVLALFILVAAVFRMHTILFLAKGSIGVLATAALVVFQPELRRALEKLGEKSFYTTFLVFDRGKENQRFSDKTKQAIVTACLEMSKVKTGALIVVEQAIHLNEFEHTGIELDAKVSTQVLLNIFEHNTPLHDGAIIVRGERITSATCYLPLSENMQISKDLGTRHRAALGMSEVSDALVVVVSEETGHISVAVSGQLTRNITGEQLDEQLTTIQHIHAGPKWSSKGKGRKKSEV